jgi:hypothetical protein
VTSAGAWDSYAGRATRFYGFNDTASPRIGVRPANITDNPGILAGCFPTLLHRTSLEPYLGSGRGRRSGTRQANRHPGAARHEVGGQTRFRPLPRSAQPAAFAVLAEPKAARISVTLTERYGDQTRKLEYASSIAVRYHAGMAPAAIRWVLMRDPSGHHSCNLVAATTTRTGLNVKCEIDPARFPAGVKVTNAEMAAINIAPHEFHDE